MKTRSVVSKRALFLILCICASVCSYSTTATAAIIYVEPADDTPNGTGTFEDPYESISEAIEVALPGDIIQMRGGRYFIPQTLQISKSGTENNRITLMSYPGEWATINGSQFSVFDDDLIDNSIFRLSGASYWNFKNFTSSLAPAFGISMINSTNNIRLENLRVHNNGGTGINIASGSNNILVLNVDSYRNFDRPNNGQDADGFAAKFSVGQNIIFRGCRAWSNSDDGWDFWMAGANSGITVENSYAYENGIDVWNFGPDFEGNGNGFKLGQGQGSHFLRNNLSWGHPSRGFEDNNNSSGVTLYNNTSYNNGVSFRFDSGAKHVLRNNLAFGGGEILNNANDDISNSWNLPIVVDASDFLSLDDRSARADRVEGGALPSSDFLKLAPGSDAINQGVNVGLDFSGEAPDLGAIEATKSDSEFSE